MKTNISYSLVAAAAFLSLASCSEGQYWTEPADKGAVVAFAKPAVNVSVSPTATAPESYEVTLYRSEVNGNDTVDVAFATNSPEVLSGSGSNVVFLDGQNTAKYVISIGDIMPGVTYSASLSVKQPENVLTQVNTANLEFTFKISQELKWEAAGTAAVTETLLIGNEIPLDMPVEEGNWPIEGQRLFRISNLYHNFAPDDIAAGTEVRFFTDDQGNPIGLFSDWTYTGYIEDGSYFFFGLPAQFGSYFTRDGNMYLMHGVMGTAASENGGAVDPGWYEDIAFQWECPAK